MTVLEDLLRLKIKKVRPTKRIRYKSITMPLYALEAQIERMAQEEEAMTRYEHGQEVW